MIFTPPEFMASAIARTLVLPMRTPGDRWPVGKVFEYLEEIDDGDHGEGADLAGWAIFVLRYVDNDGITKWVCAAAPASAPSQLAVLGRFMVQAGIALNVIGQPTELPDGALWFAWINPEENRGRS